MQKQYNLRNRNVPIIANKTQPKKDTPKVVDGKKDICKVAEGKKDTPPLPPIKEAENIFMFLVWKMKFLRSKYQYLLVSQGK